MVYITGVKDTAMLSENNMQSDYGIADRSKLKSIYYNMLILKCDKNDCFIRVIMPGDLLGKCKCTIVTQHEKAGLMYTKYTCLYKTDIFIIVQAICNLQVT